jgi:cobalt-zinc-cadmium efflux system outer membrane protein
LAGPEEGPPAVPASLTLEDALRLVLRRNPSLASSAWRARAAKARVKDESRRPNPALDAAEENVGGGLGTHIGETTISLSQSLDLGGDRRARTAVAGGLERLAANEFDSNEREVIALTTEVFLDAWWLERRLSRLKAAEEIGAAAVAAAGERIRVGAAPPLERIRAEGSLAERGAERRQTEAELADARRRLALQWGAAEAAFDSLVLAPPEVPALPPAEVLIARLDAHPERRLAAAEVAVEEARLGEARAARVPDLDAHAGVRRLAEFGENGFIAGVSMPIPLWNPRRGAVEAADAERRAASSHERAVAGRLEQELRGAYDRLIAARDAYQAAHDRVAPLARAALGELEAGYRSGRFSYLDHLEGQRAALDADLLVLKTAHDTWSARFELERLLGQSLDTIAAPKEER